MRKHILFLSFTVLIVSALSLTSCRDETPKVKAEGTIVNTVDGAIEDVYDTNNDTLETTINSIINKWHKDAANSNYESYFDLLDDSSIFIGTDKTERWDKKEFQTFAKPYFKSKKTWDFKTISRNIYFSKDKGVAWFDELLDTWMGTCRSSGVLEYSNDDWILKHYHLSVTIDNDKIKQFIIISSDN